MAGPSINRPTFFFDLGSPYAYLAEWHVFKVTQGWFTSLPQETAAALDCVNRALDAGPADSLELTPAS